MSRRALEKIVVCPKEVKHGSGKQMLIAQRAGTDLIVVYSRRQAEFPPFGETDAVMLNYLGEYDNDKMREALRNFLRELGKHPRGEKTFNTCYIAYHLRFGGKSESGKVDRFRDLVAGVIEDNPVLYGHVETPLKFRVDLCSFVGRLSI